MRCAVYGVQPTMKILLNRAFKQKKAFIKLPVPAGKPLDTHEEEQ